MFKKMTATAIASSAFAAVALFGAPAQAQTDMRLIGEIIPFGGNFCPRNTLPADGRLLEISKHTALYSIYGTMYGGDARTTFALPDLPSMPTNNGRDIRFCVVIMGTFPSRS